MGKQVGIFADEIDEAILLDYATTIGLRVFIEATRSTKEPSFLRPNTAHSRSRLYTLQLVRSDLPSDRLARLPGTDSQLGVTALTHPLIAFSRSPRDKSVIRNGRIYFENREDIETSKLYERLARFIRKWPKADRYRFYVGPHTAEASRAGVIRLMHHREELHPI
jgi:hypothetical protein